MAKYTTEKIIDQFNAVHGDKYDYSLVDYQGDKSKVKIICKKHGEFEQWVSGHKKGSGCKKCSLESIKPKGSTEQLIQKFKLIHGDRYDYSQVKYTRMQDKIRIICGIHGVFEQRATMHKKGQGCAKCMYDGKRHSFIEVIHKFNEIHGSKYDYSKSVYLNTDTPIQIICPNHGVFEQPPERHLRGNGCPKCIGRLKTQDEVVSEFVSVHGDTYDYKKVKFIGVTKKVTITCNIHGDFEQLPHKHISGQGCHKCAGTVKFSLDEVLNQFKAVHGDLYDYSEVKYENIKTKVKIICNEHGAFFQQSYVHAGGSGCPRCAGNYNLNTNIIIKQFREIHGNTYDYSHVKYTNAFDSVEIICHKHGMFTQVARSHKRGSGCPDCAVTIGHTKSSYVEYCNSYDGKTHLYLIECSNDSEFFYKVGISRLGALERFNTKLKMPYNFIVLKEVYGDASEIWDLEKKVHNLLSCKKYRPEIDFHGKTECFSKISSTALEAINNFSCN